MHIYIPEKGKKKSDVKVVILGCSKESITVKQNVDNFQCPNGTLLSVTCNTFFDIKTAVNEN